MKKLQTLLKQPYKLLMDLLILYLCFLILDLLHCLDFFLRCITLFFPLVFSVFIVFIIEPCIEKIPGKRIVGCLIVYGGFLFLCVSSVILIGPMLLSQVNTLWNLLPETIRDMVMQTGKGWFSTDKIDTTLKTIMDTTITSTMGMVSGISKVSLGYIAAFFISLDLEFFRDLLKKYWKDYPKFLRFYKTCSHVIPTYLIGVLYDILFLTFAVGIALFWFNLPAAFIYSLILALLNIIPYIGAIIGQIIICIAAWTSQGSFPWLAVISVFIIQQIEANIVQPIIFKKVMNLRPIFTLFTALFCGAVFGFFGVLLSPLIASIIQLFIVSYHFTSRSDKIGTWETVWYCFEDEQKVFFDEQEKEKPLN